MFWVASSLYKPIPFLFDVYGRCFIQILANNFLSLELGKS